MNQIIGLDVMPTCYTKPCRMQTMCSMFDEAPAFVALFFSYIHVAMPYMFRIVVQALCLMFANHNFCMTSNCVAAQLLFYDLLACCTYWHKLYHLRFLVSPNTTIGASFNSC